jgi:DNA-binding transcriptional MerR regulator
MDLFSIGQVAKRVGMTIEAIRYYEREGLLAEPGRLPSGYRQYTEDAVHRLHFVRRAKRYGFTLKEIKGLLALYEDLSATRRDVQNVADEKIAAIETQIRELRATEKSLKKLRALCAGDGPAHDCPILTTIAGHFQGDE